MIGLSLTGVEICGQNALPIRQNLGGHLDRPEVDELFGVRLVLAWRLQVLKSPANGDVQFVLQRQILQHGHVASHAHHVFGLYHIGREEPLEEASRRVPTPSHRRPTGNAVCLQRRFRPRRVQ